jgi:hypothetical protein
MILQRSCLRYLILFAARRTPWMGDQPVAKPLLTHRTIQTTNKLTQITATQVGCDPKTLVFERLNIVNVLDTATSVVISDSKDHLPNTSLKLCHCYNSLAPGIRGVFTALGRHCVGLTHTPRRPSVSQVVSGPGSRLHQVMSDLWWTERVSSEYCSFPCHSFIDSQSSSSIIEGW